MIPFNSPDKQFIRQSWNTPLLHYITQEKKIKLHYFGLPGVEALDIKEWRNYIDRVTVFEAPDNVNSGKGSKNAALLESNLIKMGYEPTCYTGFIEETLMSKFDNNGKELLLDEFYTLVNLDFCNHLSSKTLINQAKICARFAVFSKITEKLKDAWLANGISGSIWLLTVRQEIHKNAYAEWLAQLDDSSELIKYAKSLSRYDKKARSKNLVKNVYKLRLIVYSVLKSALNGNRFSDYWFPMILYKGTKGTPMAHFIILTHVNDIKNVYPARLQSLSDFVSNDILFVNDNSLCSIRDKKKVIGNTTSFIQDTLGRVNFPFISPLCAAA